MDSTVNERQSTPDLEGLRSALFSSAKKLWGFGLAAAYSAVLVVPGFLFLQLPRWTGAIVALLLAITGLLFRARSDAIRGDAEALHRANELSRGLGYPIAPSVISDLRHRYSHLGSEAKDRQDRQAGYYDRGGEPSTGLLTAMLHESAWWTSRLAATARNRICMAAAIGFSAPVAVLLSDLDHVVRAYGALACAVMLIDLVSLGWRYEKLRAGSSLSFEAFDQVDLTGMEERDAIILATNYQMVRASGPLVPDWLWKRQRERLQDAWDVALGKRGGAAVEVHSAKP